MNPLSPSSEEGGFEVNLGFESVRNLRVNPTLAEGEAIEINAQEFFNVAAALRTPLSSTRSSSIRRRRSFSFDFGFDSKWCGASSSIAGADSSFSRNATPSNGQNQFSSPGKRRNSLDSYQSATSPRRNMMHIVRMTTNIDEVEIGLNDALSSSNKRVSRSEDQQSVSTSGPTSSAYSSPRRSILPNNSSNVDSEYDGCYDGNYDYDEDENDSDFGLKDVLARAQSALQAFDSLNAEYDMELRVKTPHSAAESLLDTPRHDDKNPAENNSPASCADSKLPLERSAGLNAAPASPGESILDDNEPNFTLSASMSVATGFHSQINEKDEQDVGPKTYVSDAQYIVYGENSRNLHIPAATSTESDLPPQDEDDQEVHAFFQQLGAGPSSDASSNDADSTLHHATENGEHLDVVAASYSNVHDRGRNGDSAPVIYHEKEIKQLHQQQIIAATPDEICQQNESTIQAGHQRSLSDDLADASSLHDHHATIDEDQIAPSLSIGLPSSSSEIDYSILLQESTLQSRGSENSEMKDSRAVDESLEVLRSHLAASTDSEEQNGNFMYKEHVEDEVERIPGDLTAASEEIPRVNPLARQDSSEEECDISDRFRRISYDSAILNAEKELLALLQSPQEQRRILQLEPHSEEHSLSDNEEHLDRSGGEARGNAKESDHGLSHLEMPHLTDDDGAFYDDAEGDGKLASFGSAEFRSSDTPAPLDSASSVTQRDFNSGSEHVPSTRCTRENSLLTAMVVNDAVGQSSNEPEDRTRPVDEIESQLVVAVSSDTQQEGDDIIPSRSIDSDIIPSTSIDSDQVQEYFAKMAEGVTDRADAENGKNRLDESYKLSSEANVAMQIGCASPGRQSEDLEKVIDGPRGPLSRTATAELRPRTEGLLDSDMGGGEEKKDVADNEANLSTSGGNNNELSAASKETGSSHDEQRGVPYQNEAKIIHADAGVPGPSPKTESIVADRTDIPPSTFLSYPTSTAAQETVKSRSQFGFSIGNAWGASLSRLASVAANTAQTVAQATRPVLADASSVATELASSYRQPIKRTNQVPIKNHLNDSQSEAATGAPGVAIAGLPTADRTRTESKATDGNVELSNACESLKEGKPEAAQHVEGEHSHSEPGNASGARNDPNGTGEHSFVGMVSQCRENDLSLDGVCSISDGLRAENSLRTEMHPTQTIAPQPINPLCREDPIEPPASGNENESGVSLSLQKSGNDDVHMDLRPTEKQKLEKDPKLAVFNKPVISRSRLSQSGSQSSSLSGNVSSNAGSSWQRFTSAAASTAKNAACVAAPVLIDVKSTAAEIVTACRSSSLIRQEKRDVVEIPASSHPTRPVEEKVESSGSQTSNFENVKTRLENPVNENDVGLSLQQGDHADLLMGHRPIENQKLDAKSTASHGFEEEPTISGARMSQPGSQSSSLSGNVSANAGSSWQRFTTVAASTAKNAARVAAPVLIDVKSTAAEIVTVCRSSPSNRNVVEIPKSSHPTKPAEETFESSGSQASNSENTKTVREDPTMDLPGQPVATKMTDQKDDNQSSSGNGASGLVKTLREKFLEQPSQIYMQKQFELSAEFSASTFGSEVFSSSMRDIGVLKAGTRKASMPSVESSRSEMKPPRIPLQRNLAQETPRKIIEFLSTKLAGHENLISPVLDKDLGDTSWIKRTEFACFDPMESVFADSDVPCSRSLSTLGSPPEPFLSDDSNDSTASPGSQASSASFRSDGAQPPITLWDLLSDKHVSADRALPTNENVLRPDFVLMPRFTAPNPISADDGMSSPLLNASHDGRLSTRRSLVSDNSISSSAKRRRGASKPLASSNPGSWRRANPGKGFGSRRRTGAFPETDEMMLDALSAEQPRGLERLSESFSLGFQSPSRLDFIHGEQFVPSPVLHRRCLTWPNLQVTPETTTSHVDLETLRSPISTQNLASTVETTDMRRRASLNMVYLPQPFYDNAQKTDSLGAARVLQTRGAGDSKNYSIDLVGRSGNQLGVAFEDEESRITMYEEAMLEQALMHFSSIKDIVCPFQIPSRSAALQYLAEVRWKQLLANIKHAEMTKALTTRAISLHFVNKERQGRDRDEDTILSSVCGDVKEIEPLNLGGPSAPPGMSAEWKNRDGFNPQHGERSIVALSGFISLLGDSRPSETLRHALTDNTLTEDLIRSAKSYSPHLLTLLERLASFASESEVANNLGDDGVKFFVDVLKDWRKIEKKAKQKYGGDILRVKDVLRGSLIFQDEASLLSGLTYLDKLCSDSKDQVEVDSKNQGENGIFPIKLVRIRNFFATDVLSGCLVPSSLPTGYRFILVHIRLKNEFLAEIQFHLAPFYDILGEGGPALHNEVIDLEQALSAGQLIGSSSLGDFEFTKTLTKWLDFHRYCFSGDGNETEEALRTQNEHETPLQGNKAKIAAGNPSDLQIPELYSQKEIAKGDDGNFSLINGSKKTTGVNKTSIVQRGRSITILPGTSSKLTGAQNGSMDDYGELQPSGSDISFSQLETPKAGRVVHSTFDNGKEQWQDVSPTNEEEHTGLGDEAKARNDDAICLLHKLEDNLKEISATDFLLGLLECGTHRGAADPRDAANFYCLYRLCSFFLDREDDSINALLDQQVILHADDILDFSRQCLLRCFAVCNQATSTGMTGWVEYGSSFPLGRLAERRFVLLVGLASTYARNGDWQDCQDVFESLALRCEQQLPLFHPTTLISLMDLSAAASMNGDATLAEKTLSRVVDRLSFYLTEIEESHFLVLERNIADSKAGKTMLRLEQERSSISMLTAFAGLFEDHLEGEMLRFFGADHVITLVQRCLVGDCYAVLANCVAALSSSFGSNGDGAKRELHLWKSAFLHYKLCLDALSRQVGLGNAALLAAAYGVARCLRELGEPERALKVLSTVVKVVGDPLQFSPDHGIQTSPNAPGFEDDVRKTTRQTTIFLPSSFVNAQQFNQESRHAASERIPAAMCLWLMAILTAEKSPSYEGRTRAFGLLRSASVTLQAALAALPPKGYQALRCVELLRNIDAEARLLRNNGP